MAINLNIKAKEVYEMNINYKDIVIETTQNLIWKEYFRYNDIYTDILIF